MQQGRGRFETGRSHTFAAMGLKSVFTKPFARRFARHVRKWAAQPIESQDAVLQGLIEKGSDTQFGKEHGFGEIRDYKDFKARVPVRDYEQIKPYIDRILKGERDVLWPGRPEYFAKTSGTTSGTKYIPLTKDSIPNHMDSARNALMCYVYETNDASVFDGKMMFISGSPALEEKNGIKVGRLSGIVNYHVPWYVKRNQMPSFETNCIDDFEHKLDVIIEETLREDMRMISGIPPWTLMYFEKINQLTGKPVCEVFPNFSLYIYGGVNYEPYRVPTEAALGKSLPSIETYPASEGFIAFQDTQTEPGLLLNVNSGIFFEFIPLHEVQDENPTRISLKDVDMDTQYAIIINNNAGLWGYLLGDTVRFVSKHPYRLEVSGRIKHFISAFGEHVIVEEVEAAMTETAAKRGGEVIEFHVAPMVNPGDDSLPYHEWFVEFGQKPDDLDAFAEDLDKALRKRNSYYDDLINGKILRRLVLKSLPAGSFREHMRSKGKLGGQNKVPRLANDRSFAGGLGAHL